jgi:outer membrane lipoprotein SlyB
MDKRMQLAAALLVATMFAGCAEGLGGGSYTRDEARREQNVRMGVVESVRQVQIEGTRTIVGPAAARLAYAGSTVGGAGSDIAAVLGVVPAALPARRLNRYDAAPVEITTASRQRRAGRDCPGSRRDVRR